MQNLQARSINAILTICLLSIAPLGVACGANPSADTKPPSSTASTAPAQTLDDLQAAFDGESNAHARYVAFAEKADGEGYKQVAVLFRAAARAEQVHAANHARVIKALGAAPSAAIKSADVKSTAENLDAAIKGETYERDTMYPKFLEHARNASLASAVQTLTFARDAEAEHARLFSDARTSLGERRNAGQTTYYVCAVCGFTTTALTFAKCPVCASPKEVYEAFS